MWMAIVPAIVRTEPEPTPSRSIASIAALAQPRMRGQPEVVVRGEIDDSGVVERGRGASARHRGREDGDTAPGRLQRFELGRKVGERVGAHADSIVSRAVKERPRARRDATGFRVGWLGR